MYMQVLPNPYPVPIFRSSTEVNLGKDILIDPDRKYMVQTLATMLMSYVQRPSLKDCLVVAKALHAKFKFLGDESSEVKLLILLFICTYSLPPPPPNPNVNVCTVVILSFMICVECLEVVYIHTNSECEQAY